MSGGFSDCLNDFLKKDGDLWAGSNWHFSLRPITGANVLWYGGGENPSEMKPAALAAVVGQIKMEMARKTGAPKANRVAPPAE